MDDKFIPYDYTKYPKPSPEDNNEDNEEGEGHIVEHSTAPDSAILTSISTAGSLLRRVGEKIEQSKYKSQGYYELSIHDDNTSGIEAPSATISNNKSK